MAVTLNFTASTTDLTDDANLPNELGQIATYLDGIIQAAEISASITTRLFAKPVIRRLRVPGLGFGRLAITVGGSSPLGKLAVTSATPTVVGVDPIGLQTPLVGTMDPGSANLPTYLNLMLAIAESDKGFDNSTRRLDDATVTFDAGRTLITTIPVSKVVGGPAATVTLAGSSGLDDLFTASATTANSATTFNNAQAMHDTGALFDDVFTVATQRLIDASRDPKIELGGWNVAMVIPVETATNIPGDPDSVQSWESWSVTPLSRPFDFRGVEIMMTTRYAKDKTIQLQAIWTLDFFTGAGKPDNALICHELGHGIGFRDLYSLQSARPKQLSICVHLAVNQWGERSKAVKIDERPMRVAKPTRRDRDDVPVNHRGDGIDRWRGQSTANSSLKCKN